MKAHKYTEDELRKEKYNNLLKISKELGLKTRRIKTEKLIEAIISAQAESTPEQPGQVVSVGSSDADAGQDRTLQEQEPSKEKTKEEAEELLTDIQFPELLSPEEAVLEDELFCKNTPEDPHDKSVSKTGNKKRTRTGTFDLETGQVFSKNTSEDPHDKSVSKTGNKKRTRTGTFDIENGQESLVSQDAGNRPKRRRTSTFEVHKEEKTTSNLDCTYEVEKDTKESLSDSCTPEAGRCRPSTYDIPKEDEDKSVESDHVQVNDEKTAKNTEQLSLLNKKLRKKSPKGSIANNSPSRGKSLHNKAGVEVSKKLSNQASGKTSEDNVHKMPKKFSITKRRSKDHAGTLKTDLQETQQNSEAKSAKTIQPSFTIGCGSTAKRGNAGEQSNIPRFVAYARKLKVPNFAKIHENAFNRMEALDDYIDKKRTRTENLGSSTKRPVTSSQDVFKPSVTTVRNLNLNFTASKSSCRTPQAETSKRASTGITSVSKSLKKSSGLSKQVISNSSLSRQTSLRKIRSPVAVKNFKKGKRKSPRISVMTPKLQKEPIMPSTTIKPTNYPDIKENIKPDRKSLKSPATCRNLLTPGSIRKSIQSSAKTPGKKPIGYVPHTREDLKKLANKQPGIKSRKEVVEGQKRILKGVRINKRFELQMAKRGITLL